MSREQETEKHNKKGSRSRNSSHDKPLFFKIALMINARGRHPRRQNRKR
jgi:hypothetical protein